MCALLDDHQCVALEQELHSRQSLRAPMWSSPGVQQLSPWQYGKQNARPHGRARRQLVVELHIHSLRQAHSTLEWYPCACRVGRHCDTKTRDLLHQTAAKKLRGRIKLQKFLAHCASARNRTLRRSDPDETSAGHQIVAKLSVHAQSPLGLDQCQKRSSMGM